MRPNRRIVGSPGSPYVSEKSVFCFRRGLFREFKKLPAKAVGEVVKKALARSNLSRLAPAALDGIRVRIQVRLVAV